MSQTFRPKVDDDNLNAILFDKPGSEVAIMFADFWNTFLYLENNHPHQETLRRRVDEDIWRLRHQCSTEYADLDLVSIVSFRESWPTRHGSDLIY